MNEMSSLKKEQKELKNTVDQLENKSRDQENEIEVLKAKNEMHEKMYRKSKEEVRQLNLKVEELLKIGSKKRENNLIPSNCNDLKQIGHSLNGFYTDKNPHVDKRNKKMRLIFCDFSSASKKGS